ncbi:MAG: cbb3-type cytochrome oxidase assembly protein CcoS [Spirochaetia bacterium]|nr:cbb3-type cytochrome oxidase assembly protein CcoS [Spirochaetia bacterium]
MSALYITLPIAIFIALGFLIFFMWSVKNRDYEDTEMPKYKMLMDDKDDIDTTFKNNKK